MRALTPYVVAEGRIHAPQQAAEAVRRGAFMVVVGSALTRLEHATGWFAAAVHGAARARDTSGEAVLAIDIGGTKIAAAIVAGGNVRDEAVIATARAAGPDAWLDAVAEAARGWGEVSAVGAAVTGFIRDGRWSALNPAVLGIPDDYPLVERLARRFGRPAYAANDAQAAAWGEHRFGAGAGGDMVFLTISTGIGGGIVLDGKLRSGLAGHFGQWRLPTGEPVEDMIAGRGIAAAARAAGHSMEAPGVFAAAATGEDWAEAIVAASARRAALLCGDIQMSLAPPRLVIGGGIGLAPGYLARIRHGLDALAPALRPELVPAELGARAGLIGVADLARTARLEAIQA